MTMKKCIIFTLTLITTIITLNINNAHAAFKDTGWGTRPAGMGGAFVAVANDSNAPLWNPAGIAQMKNAEGTFMYSTYYNGLDLKAGDDSVTLGFNYLGFVYPKSSIGAFGVSWANFTASNLYKEDTYAITYAKRLNDWFPGLVPKVYVGVNLKSMGHAYTLDQYAQNDPVFTSGGTSKSAFTADIGAMIKPYDKLVIGLTGKNLTQPDVGLKDTDKVPMEILVGVAYRNFNVGNVILTPALDVTSRDGDTRFHAGIEGWLFNKALGVRAGFNSTEATLGFSFNGMRSETFGVNIDYSFIMPMQIESSSGSHRISMGVWF